MEQLIMAIAAPLARTYGINKAIEIAYEKLGLNSPTQTEVDVLTGGGINQAFAPGNLVNMAKRGAVNLGIRSVAGKGLGVLGPLGLVAGLAFLGNKYRKQLTGYDTQAAYEAARDQRRADKRLDKITDRIIGGKNYGNYKEALLDSGAGAVDIDGTIYSGPDYQGESKSKSKSKSSYQGPTGKDIHGGGGGSGGAGGGKSGGFSSAERGASLHGAKGGLARYYRGGIATL